MIVNFPTTEFNFFVDHVVTEKIILKLCIVFKTTSNKMYQHKNEFLFYNHHRAFVPVIMGRLEHITVYFILTARDEITVRNLNN